MIRNNYSANSGRAEIIIGSTFTTIYGGAKNGTKSSRFY